MSVQVTIQYNDFAEAGAEDALKKVITATCVRMHAEATQLAPVDFGQLRNSIMWRTSWNNEEDGFNDKGGDSAPSSAKLDARFIKSIEGVVGSNLEYAPYQEFGTRYMPAQPYLRPAVDVVKGANASQIANKWGNEAMKNAYKRGRRRSRNI